MLAAPSADQVRALAPDDGVARSGEGLANPRHWTGLGRSERAAWGLCQGSGSSPYQVVADLVGLAAKCSCPSRKFPCKHGVGLLLLLGRSSDAVPVAAPPPFAETWLASRDTRAQAAETRAAKGPDTPVDEAARAKRIAAREQKVTAGVAELDRWLRDVVRRGLATAKGEGYGFWDAAGARLVDAQASGLARSVRGLGEIVNSGDGWPDRTLERLGRLHLLASAYGRLDTLPEPLRADVRTLVGWTTKEDDLPAESAVEDRWLTVGRTVDEDERLTTARTWLVGETTGRFALHLAFGVAGSAPELLAVTGIAVRGSVAFFPSATPLRAAARGAVQAAGIVDRLPAGRSIAATAQAFTELLAGNPFLESWPVILDPVVPVRGDDGLRLVDGDGSSVLTTTSAELVPRILAASGGHPMTVFGEWLGDRVAPLSALIDGRLVDLTLERPLTRPDGKRAPGPGRWPDLVTMALLGTGRSRTVEPGVVLAAIEAVEPESAVLATAGARAVERRASWAPDAHAGTRPPTADDDPRPLAPVPALAILRRLLSTRESRLVAEWLTLAAQRGMRAPHEELPDLLVLAGASAEVRDAVGDPGPRARWLVDAVPELRTAATSSGGTRADWDDARTPAERAAALAAIRRRDPEEGRAILEADWATLPPDARPKAIAALADGLSDADEPMLERALDERRMETRQAAADLLARLPGSALTARMEVRARPLIASKPGKRPALVIGLPEWSDDFARDGIVRAPTPGAGERASWRHQILQLVAPERWVAWLGIDAAELVARAAASEDGEEVLSAWVAAVDERFPDAAFAATLLERDPSAIGLIRHLDPARAEPKVLAAIAAAVIDPAVLEAIPRPWSEAIGDGVIDALAVEAGGAPNRAWAVRQAARVAATHLPVRLANDFEAALFGGMDPNARLAHADTVALIRLREELARAFAAP